jgi:selenocysteine lyase/cysteine desulfurase
LQVLDTAAREIEELARKSAANVHIGVERLEASLKQADHQARTRVAESIGEAIVELEKLRSAIVEN